MKGFDIKYDFINKKQIQITVIGEDPLLMESLLEKIKEWVS